MSDSRSKTVLTLFAGMMIGGAMGVAAGILLAPDKGSVTRGRVKEKLDDLADEFTDKVEDLVDKFGNVVEDAQEVMEEKVESAKEKVDEVKDKVKNKMA